MTMQQQFWVIGAEYSSVACDALIPGTGCLLGPFDSYDDAREVWRERSMESRSQATTRYTIVSSAASMEIRGN